MLIIINQIKIQINLFKIKTKLKPKIYRKVEMLIIINQIKIQINLYKIKIKMEMLIINHQIR